MRLLLLLWVGLLAGCQDREPVAFESTAVVEIHQMAEKEEIDWNSEIKVLSSEEVLGRAAESAGVEPSELDRGTRTEVQVEESSIKIVGRHKSEKTARRYAQSLAEAFREVRNAEELRRRKEQLAEIDRELEKQAEEVEKARENLMKLVEEYQIPSSGAGKTLEQDKLTYEKAKAALEEGERGGILFKKEGK